MKIRLFLSKACAGLGLLGAFVPAIKSEPQGQKIRVWVCPGNADASMIAQGVEAKLNGTQRFETVRDTYATDLILYINCLNVQDNANKLKDQWTCSSGAQIVAGDVIAVPYDDADNLVVGTPDYIATAMFERAASHAGDSELRKARENFRKRLSLYCKTFSCS